MAAKLGTIPIGKVVRRQLARDIVKFRALAKAVSPDEDPEVIHKARVQARRIRVAFKAYRPILSPSLIHLDSDLKWIAASLGAVRDVDVQAAFAPEILLELRVLRAERFDQLMGDLASQRQAELVKKLSSESKRRPLGVLSQALALQAAPDIIGRAYRSFKRAKSDAKTDEDIHRLRKRAKRLRYTFDPFASIYGAPAKTFDKCLKDLQEAFGYFQDAVVTCRIVDQLESLASKGEIADAVKHAESRKQEAKAKIDDCLEALPPTWKKLAKRMAKTCRRLWK